MNNQKNETLDQRIIEINNTIDVLTKRENEAVANLCTEFDTYMTIISESGNVFESRYSDNESLGISKNEKGYCLGVIIGEKRYLNEFSSMDKYDPISKNILVHPSVRSLFPNYVKIIDNATAILKKDIAGRKSEIKRLASACKYEG